MTYRFFLLKIEDDPVPLIEALSARSKNVWVKQQELIEPEKLRVSGLTQLLDTVVPGGLAAIPFSSELDLHAMRERFEGLGGKQLSFAFK